MAKKYFLAKDPILFNSLEDAVSFVEELRKTEDDTDNIMIGSLIGKIEQSTSFVIRNGSNKVKKVKTKSILPVQEEKASSLSIKEEEIEEKPNILQCSFCHRLKVKTSVVDGIPTHLCEEHLSIEKELLNVGN